MRWAVVVACLGLAVAGCSSTASTSSPTLPGPPAVPAATTSPQPSPPAPPPRPTLQQASAALTGMYAALAERNPAVRDQFILAAVRPKVTTDVVDDVGAATVTVSEVTPVKDPSLAPGAAKYTATVTLVQDDGDAQVERHWFVLTTTPQGVRLANTGRLEVVEYMPEDPPPPEPTPEPEPTSGGEGPEDNYGIPFREGVPCDGPATAEGCDARLKVGVDY